MHDEHVFEKIPMQYGSILNDMSIRLGFPKEHTRARLRYMKEFSRNDEETWAKSDMHISVGILENK